MEKGNSKADSDAAGRQHRVQAWFLVNSGWDSVHFPDGFAAIRCRHSKPVASMALPVRRVPLAQACAGQAADAGLAGCGTARKSARNRHVQFRASPIHSGLEPWMGRSPVPVAPGAVFESEGKVADPFSPCISRPRHRRKNWIAWAAAAAATAHHVTDRAQSRDSSPDGGQAMAVDHSPRRDLGRILLLQRDSAQGSAGVDHRGAAAGGRGHVPVDRHAAGRAQAAARRPPVARHPA